MRISGISNLEVTNQITLANNTTKESVEKSGSDITTRKDTVAIEPMMLLKNGDETKAKVQEAVNKMNEMLDVNNSTSKFMFHEGLERYYVTVVNRDTEEVVKEIPPKKLLDAFYEMQKMLGMVVDEKI
ncbi:MULTISPECIES: flagellar protein FlaG [Solibacillus]|uniref:Flagellar protein FlaG n=1 Tax=Solibacillus merdavium TaxID=2762218 RepID=A0ABR8XHQ9_9BACL|nr:flagellar protein FlaG [Solibacillus merdavium]MBD8031477.1 flagellar protein FlaG [Solibacillus merdavium]